METVLTIRKEESNVPKIKSNRGAMKRFKVTGSGKVKRSRGFKGHLLSSKGKKRKRRLRQSTMVADVESKNIRRLIPYL
jgi:large subunit ribosomal protein L35